MTAPIEQEILPPAGDRALLPSLGSPELSVEYLAKVKEILESLLGRRTGSQWDRAVTFRDMYGVNNLGQGGAFMSGGFSLRNENGIQLDQYDEFMREIERKVRASAAFKSLQNSIGSVNDLLIFPEEIRNLLTIRLEDLARERLADVRTTTRALQTQKSSFASMVTELTSALDDNVAAIRRVDTTYSDSTRAMAASILEVTARMNDINGDESSVTIEQKFLAQADVNTGLLGQYSLKIVSGTAANPVIAGMAISSETPIEGPTTSDIVFLADRLSFFTSLGNIPPFIADATGLTVNGDVRINGNSIIKGTLNVYAADGVTLVLSAGGLQAGFEAPGTKNNQVSISATGVLSGAGGGQVTALPTVDLGDGTFFGARNRNDAPNEYPVGTTKQFKTRAFLLSNDGLFPGGAETYCTLETIKQFINSSGGGIYQYAYVGNQTFRRHGPNPAALTITGDAWFPWVQDLDRNAYTGDLNATLGADASNLKAAVGGKNALSNSLPATTAGYTFGMSGGVVLEGAGLLLASVANGFDIYTRTRHNSVYLHATNSPSLTTFADIYANAAPNRMLVTPLQRYEFGVDLSLHRCSGYIVVAWYTAAGTYITEAAGNLLVSNGHTYEVGEAFGRSSVFVTMPANAATCMVLARALFNGDGNPYIFASEWYAGPALAAQTAFSPWSEMAANAAVNTALATSEAAAANAALVNKLNKNSDDILGGVLAINTVAVPVGMRVGTIAWNAAGARTSGYGIAMTPQGLIGYNASGTLTFFINGTNGDAYFAGQLAAAYGSFGAVTIASGGSISSGQSAFNTGTGFWLGLTGGVPKFSIGTAGGARLTWDGTTLSIVNATLATPVLDAFTMLPFGDAFYDIAAGVSTSLGTFTATPSGGRTPYKYVWSIIGTGFRISSASSTAASCTVHAIGSPAGNILKGFLTCTVTDDNQRSVSATYNLEVELS